MGTVTPSTTAWPQGVKREPLLHRLVRFGRALQGAGVAVNPAKLIDLTRSFELIDISKRAEFHAVARAIFVSRYDDITVFDQVFAQYWTLFERKTDDDSGAGHGEEDDDASRSRRRGRGRAPPRTASLAGSCGKKA